MTWETTEQVNFGVDFGFANGKITGVVDVYQKTLFDTIYHEHLSYHSVSPLVNFFKSKKMELIDVKKVNTHGGSIRCVV